jgi:hypothetical protein
LKCINKATERLQGQFQKDFSSIQGKMQDMPALFEPGYSLIQTINDLIKELKGIQ